MTSHDRVRRPANELVFYSNSPNFEFQLSNVVFVQDPMIIEIVDFAVGFVEDEDSP